MQIFHDARCVEYGSSDRPEQPARLARTVPHLQALHPEWSWKTPPAANRDQASRAHESTMLDRLEVSEDFDSDTPWFPEIDAHAYRATGCAVAATAAALQEKTPCISLMRPPGHHATPTQAMGFCYLNHIAIAALHAQAELGAQRVAIWDFDAHHGNGTEDILAHRPDILFTSVHQSPCYPGTGLSSFANCHNWPVPPRAARERHMEVLLESWDRVIAFDPDLVLVSAGFDAYAGDPITDMTLEKPDFATLGTWLTTAPCPVAAVLEGGYSRDLPELVEAFLSAWSGIEPIA